MRVDWLEKQVFGSKSERNLIDASQTTLELGVEPAPQTSLHTTALIATHERRVSNKPTSVIPDDLPVISEETILPDVDVTRCEQIGDEVSRRLERIPAQIGWHLIHRPKLQDRISGEIHSAPLPAHCNEKGLAGASVIASVYTDKFQFHQSLHRQSQAIGQQTRVGFAESTLVDMVTTANFWLYPIAARILELVLTKGKKGKVLSGCEWVIFCPQMKAAVFRYEPGRAQKFAEELLKPYRGRLQTDDYVGYYNLRLLEGITPIGCLPMLGAFLFVLSTIPIWLSGYLTYTKRFVRLSSVLVARDSLMRSVEHCAQSCPVLS